MIRRLIEVAPGKWRLVSKQKLQMKRSNLPLPYVISDTMDPVEQATTDPVERVFVLLQNYRQRMARESCRLGCPIGNLALEVSDGNPAARELLHKNFENWTGRVERWLTAAGDRLPRDVDRRRLARFVLTVMEGGLMQSRAAGHLGPFDEATALLRDYFSRVGVSTARSRRGRKTRHAKGKVTKR